jgi:hypothetical protein
LRGRIGILVFVICIGLLSIPLHSDGVPTSTPVDSSPCLANLNVTQSAIPDSCVYPATYTIENDTSFIIRGNYVSDVEVSQQEAVNISFAFLEDYLPPSLTSGLRIGYTGEGYWPGSPNLVLDYWPRWEMTIVGDNLEAWIFVNALTGKVVYFNLAEFDKLYEFLNSSADAHSPINTTEGAESCFSEFFTAENYTLPLDAIYGGVTHHTLTTIPYYSVGFQQRVRGVSVAFSELYCEIDATYGLVNHFVYRWIEIGDVPAERVITPNELDKYVFQQFHSPKEVIIASRVLTLGFVGYNLGEPDFVLRLLYDVRCDTTTCYACRFDAITGDFLSSEMLLCVSLLHSVYFRLFASICIVLIVSRGTEVILERTRTKG